MDKLALTKLSKNVLTFHSKSTTLNIHPVGTSTAVGRIDDVAKQKRYFMYAKIHSPRYLAAR